MNSAVQFLEQAAARFPGRPALEDAEVVLNYAQLRQRSRAVGAFLLRQAARPDVPKPGAEEHSAPGSGGRVPAEEAGSAPEQAAQPRPVLVFLPKSAAMVTAMLGALYAGRAYVPADTAAPAARLQRIVSNLRPSAVLTVRALAEKLSALDLGGAGVYPMEELLPDPAAASSGPEDPEAEALVDAALSRVTDEDPIYIMYTSGSTGEPKGVTIPHRGVIGFARWAADTFGWDRNSVLANQAPLYFDVSVMDVYGALCCGGRLILTPEVLFRYPSKLPEFLEDHAVSSIYWVPTVMIRVANAGVLEPGRLKALKTVCFAGEVMPNLQLNVWRRALPGAVFANLYGPTETDVCTACLVDRPFADAEPLPIGRPLPNYRVVLLDEEDRPAREGELCVSGSGVMLGYYGRPELTQRAFVQLDLGGVPRRFYRTGDLARYNERGELLFLGRKDGQIKIHGNRVELGEVENAGRMAPGVENCCALYDEKKERIVLFAEGEAAEPRAVLRAMRRLVPAYMLPEQVAVLPSLPYNRNRKIDRPALKQRLEEL